MVEQEKKQISVFRKVMSLIIPVINYGIILYMFINAAINPENNISFIYGYAMFIFLGEFLSIHSTGTLLSPGSRGDKILFLLIYMFFIFILSLVFNTFYPLLVIALSITAKIFIAGNKEKMQSLGLQIITFVFTTFFAFLSSAILTQFTRFPASVLLQSQNNGSGGFFYTPETLVIWGIIYFSVLIISLIVTTFIGNTKPQEELKEEKSMDKFNVIITSNGFINESPRSEEIDKLFEKVAKGKKVLLVVNATRLGSNIRAKVDVKENFEKVGAKVVDLLEVHSDNVEEIYNYDVIYGMGGTVQPMIEDFEECNFREHLLTFLKKGIYIGESAGSIILSEDTKWYYDIKRGTKPKYDVILESYKGLNLIKENIYPHYNAEKEEIKTKAKEYEKQNNIKITYLNDGEYIFKYIE